MYYIKCTIYFMYYKHQFNVCMCTYIYFMEHMQLYAINSEQNGTFNRTRFNLILDIGHCSRWQWCNTSIICAYQIAFRNTQTSNDKNKDEQIHSDSIALCILQNQLTIWSKICAQYTTVVRQQFFIWTMYLFPTTSTRSATIWRVRY